MKIVFIEPAASKANVYSKLHMPLLGPVYLATILKHRGHQVEVYNEEIYRPDYASLKADLFGISILTSTAKRGYEIARKFPKEKVIFGGVHASLLPQEALAFGRQVVVGEAEDLIADVAEGRMGEAIVQGGAVLDLDKLPFPDFSLIQGYKLPSLLMPVSTSRGCPFDCSFCSVTKVFGRTYRFRSAESVIDELQTRQAKSLFFCDDNFTAHPQRATRLLQMMIKSKLRSWTCQVRCDAAKNEGLLSLMARAGCSVVCVGFESVNIKTLQAYRKKQSLSDIINAIRAFHKNRIKIHGMFVLGSDEDNQNTVWDTLKFALKQKIDTIQMMILTPLPGTKTFDELTKQKRIFSRNWSLYDGQHVVFSPKLISARQLQENVSKAYTRFYSLSQIFLYLAKLRVRNAFFRLMGYRIIRQWLRINGSMHWIPASHE